MERKEKGTLTFAALLWRVFFVSSSLLSKRQATSFLSKKRKQAEQTTGTNPLFASPRATPRGARGLGLRLDGAKQQKRAAHLEVFGWFGRRRKGEGLKNEQNCFVTMTSSSTRSRKKKLLYKTLLSLSLSPSLSHSQRVPQLRKQRALLGSQRSHRCSR